MSVHSQFLSFNKQILMNIWNILRVNETNMLCSVRILNIKIIIYEVALLNYIINMVNRMWRDEYNFFKDTTDIRISILQHVLAITKRFIVEVRAQALWCIFFLFVGYFLLKNVLRFSTILTTLYLPYTITMQSSPTVSFSPVWPGEMCSLCNMALNLNFILLAYIAKRTSSWKLVALLDVTMILRTRFFN